MNKNFIKLTAILLFSVGGISAVSAQSSLKIGGLPFLVDSNAVLEISSTSRGFLPPRVTNTSTIDNPATGLMVYDKTANALVVNTGTSAAPIWFSTTTTAGTPIATKTDAYTIADADHTILCDNSTRAFTLTLPAAATYPGRIILIGKVDDTGNELTFSPGLKLGPTQTATTLNYSKQPFRVQSDGTNWIVVDSFF